MTLEARKEKLKILLLNPNTVELAIEMEKSLKLFGDDPIMDSFKAIASKKYHFYSPTQSGFVEKTLNENQLNFIYSMSLNNNKIQRYKYPRQSGTSTALAIFLAYELATGNKKELALFTFRRSNLMRDMIHRFYDIFKPKNGFCYQKNYILKTSNDNVLYINNSIRDIRGYTFNQIFLDNSRVKLDDLVYAASNKLISITTQ